MNSLFKAAVVACFFAMTLSSCGAETNSNTPSEQVTVTVNAEPELPAEPDVSMDEEFAELIRTEASYFRNDPSEDIIALAEIICDSFDRGMQFEEIGMLIIESGAPAFDAGFVIGASVAYLCPEYDAEIRNSNA